MPIIPSAASPLAFGSTTTTPIICPRAARPASVAISGLNITASQVGVYVQDDPASEDPVSGTDPAVSATITGGRITDGQITGGGSGIGVEVSGSNASAAISGSSVTNFGTGVFFTAGGSGSVSGIDFGGASPNATDLTIDATAGAVTIGDGNPVRRLDYYIQDLGGPELRPVGRRPTTLRFRICQLQCGDNDRRAGRRAIWAPFMRSRTGSSITWTTRATGSSGSSRAMTSWPTPARPPRRARCSAVFDCSPRPTTSSRFKPASTSAKWSSPSR